MSATWQTLGALCRALGWSRARLVYELQSGSLRHRTIPPGQVIDWHDPKVSVDVEASEVTVARSLGVEKGNGTIAFVWRGTERLTCGIEVSLPPDDAEVPSAATDSVRSAFATAKRLKTEGKIYFADDEWWLVADLQKDAEGIWRVCTVKTKATKAAVARLLEWEMEKAAKSSGVRPLKASYSEDHLAEWGIWPLGSLK
jgi:hypothetical protein